MNLTWIMFFRGGETHIDVVMHENRDHEYPFEPYYITPRHGKVFRSEVIEARKPVAAGTTSPEHER